MNISGQTGRFTHDPELKTTPKGTSVVSFNLAVPRPHTSDKTDFIDYVAWGQIAEFIARFFKKGMKIEVSGNVTTRMYEKDGQKRKITEILVTAADFAESKKAEQDGIQEQVLPDANVQPDYSGSSEKFEEIGDDEEFPF